MRSYDSATLWKTPATRSVFSDSDIPSWKPKWVVRWLVLLLLVVLVLVRVLFCVEGLGEDVIVLVDVEVVVVVVGRRTEVLVLNVH